MNYLKIAKISAGIAIFSAIMVLITSRNNNHSCPHNNSNYNTESNYISEYKEKRNLLMKLADTDKNKVLDNAERMKMYKMCDVDNKPEEYVVTLKDFNRGIKNYLEKK